MKLYFIRKLLIYTAILGAIFSLSSCEDFLVFTSFKNRLEGRWYFEKVTYHKEYSFKVENITSDFEDVYFEFERDREMTVEYLDDDGNLIQIDGQWDRQYETDCDSFDDDDSNCDDVSILQIALLQNGPLPVSNYTWKVNSLYSEKLVVEEKTINGKIKYRLRKE